MKKRALKADDKKAKRDRLLRAAVGLLSRNSTLAPALEGISMQQIARRAGVAKGTLYLYFQTKEELFLEIHRQDYETWFAAFSAFLREQPAGLEAGALADWITGALRDNPRFIHLQSIVSTLLERNVSFESGRQFKLTVRNCVLDATPHLSRVLRKDSQATLLFLSQLHALMIGLWQHAQPAEIIRKVFDSDEIFDIFRFDFFAVFHDGVERLILGTLAQCDPDHAPGYE